MRQVVVLLPDFSEYVPQIEFKVEKLQPETASRSQSRMTKTVHKLQPGGKPNKIAFRNLGELRQ